MIKFNKPKYIHTPHTHKQIIQYDYLTLMHIRVFINSHPMWLSSKKEQKGVHIQESHKKFFACMLCVCINAWMNETR